MHYQYSAVDCAGRRTGGQLEAANPIELEHRLQQMGLDLIRSQPTGHHQGLRFFKLPRRELIHFCFQLQQLTQAGISLLEALADQRDVLEHPQLKRVLTTLLQDMARGQTLSQAMSHHPNCFDPIFLSLIRAGETSGDLQSVLETLVTTLKQEEQRSNRTHKVLLYPCFVGTIILAATTFLMVHLVPQLKVFVASMGQALPMHTRALFLVSDTLILYWPAVLALLLALPLSLAILWHTSSLTRYQLDALKLKLPILGAMLKKAALARFATSFALLYAAGIPVLETLKISRDALGNRFLKQGFLRAEEAIRAGNSMAQAFYDTALFPTLVTRMIRTGEQTGALDRTLLNVAHYYDQEVQNTAERLEALIEPVLTLLLGLLLGWVMLSVLGPIYQVISQIKP